MAAGKITITFSEEGNPYGPASFEIPAGKSEKIQRFVDDVDPEGERYQHSKAMLFLIHMQTSLLDIIELRFPDEIPPDVQALIDQKAALEAQIKAATAAPMIVPIVPEP